VIGDLIFAQEIQSSRWTLKDGHVEIGVTQRLSKQWLVSNALKKHVVHPRNHKQPGMAASIAPEKVFFSHQNFN